MQLKIKKLHPDAIVPTYGTAGAACFDLYALRVSRASFVGDIVYPGHPLVCDTGLSFEIPDGYVMEIRSRSGLAFRDGVTAFPGVIDSDFRGEVKVLLMCHDLVEGDLPTRITPGDRIAQAIIQPVRQVQFLEVDELKTTARGAGGLGSTGV